MRLNLEHFHFKRSAEPSRSEPSRRRRNSRLSKTRPTMSAGSDSPARPFRPGRHRHDRKTASPIAVLSVLFPSRGRSVRATLAHEVPCPPLLPPSPRRPARIPSGAFWPDVRPTRFGGSPSCTGVCWPNCPRYPSWPTAWPGPVCSCWPCRSPPGARARSGRPRPTAVPCSPWPVAPVSSASTGAPFCGPSTGATWWKPAWAISSPPCSTCSWAACCWANACPGPRPRPSCWPWREFCGALWPTAMCRG